jgi:hypothetical protein
MFSRPLVRTTLWIRVVGDRVRGREQPLVFNRNRGMIVPRTSLASISVAVYKKSRTALSHPAYRGR